MGNSNRFLSVKRIAAAFFLLVSLVVAGVVEARTLKIAVADDVISLDPARVSRHRVTEIVQGLVYSTLLRVDSEGNYIPGLAASFQSRDGLTWEFVLQDSNDAPAHVLAADLARHFQRIVSENGLSGLPSPARERLADVRSVTSEGNHLVFHLSKPWAGLPSALVREPAARLTGSGSILSTGDFELERWDHGNRVILRRKQPDSSHLFNRLWFEVVPTSQARLDQLLNGAVQIALELPTNSLTRLSARSDVSVQLIPTTRVHFVELDVTRPPFNDVRLRRALNLAVDISNLNPQSGAENHAAATIFSPIAVGYEPTVVPFGHDPVRAREMLEQLGYSNGFEFELDVLAGRAHIAQQVQSMLRSIGVDVVLRVWNDTSMWREAVRSGSRYAWVTHWESPGIDPKDAVWEKLYSAGERNYGGYASETLDALLDRAEQTYDPTLRLEYYRTVQRYVRQEAPYLFGFTDYYIGGARAGVEWKLKPESGLGLDQARSHDY